MLLAESFNPELAMQDEVKELKACNATLTVTCQDLQRRMLAAEENVAVLRRHAEFEYLLVHGVNPPWNFGLAAPH